MLAEVNRARDVTLVMNQHSRRFTDDYDRHGQSQGKAIHALMIPPIALCD